MYSVRLRRRMSISTLQARMTAAASWSSVSASSKMLERRIFLVALIGERQRLMQGLFKATGE